MSRQATRLPNWTQGPWRRRRSRAAALAAVSRLAVIVCVALPLPANADSLTDALTDSYNHNPALQADRARQLATDEQLPQARSGWLPSISGNMDYGYRSATSQRYDANSLRQRPDWENQYHRPYGYGVTLTQPLFRGFRTVNETRKAKASIAAGRARLVDTEQTVLLDTVFAYLSVIRDRAIVKHRRDEVGIVGRILKSSSARFRNGVDTRTDVSQARARQDAARATYDKTLAKLADSEAEFEKLVGRKPGKLVRPPEVGGILPESRHAAIRLAEENNPKIASARLNAEAAKYNRKAVSGEFLPTVDLQVDYGHNHNVSSIISEREDVSAVVKVSIPIFTKGLTSSKVREAKAEEVRRRYEAHDARHGVTAATVAAFEEWRSARRRVDMIELQVKAARAAARGVRLEQEVGDRSVMDVLNAEREVVNARVALEHAQFERIASGYSLLATIGRLRPQYLKLPTAIYDAERNARRVRNKFIGTRISDLERPRTSEGRSHGAADPIATGSIAASAPRNQRKKPVRGVVFLQDVAASGLPQRVPGGTENRRRAPPRARTADRDPMTTGSVAAPKRKGGRRAAGNPSQRLADLIRLRPADFFSK